MRGRDIVCTLSALPLAGGAENGRTLSHDDPPERGSAVLTPLARPGVNAMLHAIGPGLTPQIDVLPVRQSRTTRLDTVVKDLP